VRKLEEVIDQMLMVIPGDQDHLRATLVSHRSSALFASPELVQLRWRETAMELEDTFCEEIDGEVQPPKLEPGSWQEKVFKIWMNQDV
jgi:hypothetical protein